MKAKIALRKLGSLLLHINRWCRSQFLAQLFTLFQDGVCIGKFPIFATGVVLKATDGGQIILGNNVFLGRRTVIHASGGTVVIGNDVFIGDGCMIISQVAIKIGDLSQIAEYVVIRDQDHSYSNRPIKLAGFHATPITIGKDCWLGCKSTVLRGSNIGEGAVIGAHSIVRGKIPPFTLAVGCTATVVKELPPV